MHDGGGFCGSPKVPLASVKAIEPFFFSASVGRGAAERNNLEGLDFHDRLPSPRRRMRVSSTPMGTPFGQRSKTPELPSGTNITTTTWWWCGPPGAGNNISFDIPNTPGMNATKFQRTVWRRLPWQTGTNNGTPCPSPVPGTPQ